MQLIWLIRYHGVNVGTVNEVKLNRLARGGVIDRPTIAEIGENGKEVVMPLERNTGWIDKLAERINNSNGDGQPFQIIVQVGEDTLVNKIIDGIREKSFESNGEVFAI